VSDNNLSELPDQLGELSNLKSFILQDNELDLEEAILKGVVQKTLSIFRNQKVQR